MCRLRYRELAFADLEIPLGDGERMWTPKMEARVLQELELRPDESVLEIGTGSGYLTALLAARSADVTSVELLPRLAAEAQAKLKRGGVRNARVETGDGARGYGDAQYDAIVLTGSTPVLPDAGCGSSNPAGGCSQSSATRPVMTARLVRWTAPGRSSPRICSKR